jgi:DNA-binding winged helix-turn-helix (wHTH) protein/TolB-like protein/Flp pilus assembly protein TadD
MKDKVEHVLYDFADFRLDTRQRLVLRAGETIALPPKTIDLLIVLVRNHGRVVGKDELLNSVWPGTFVEEAALAKGVHLLRKTLGEGLIETFSKRGYRIAVPVVEVSGEVLPDGQTEETTGREDGGAPRGRFAPIWKIAAAVALAAACVTGWGFLHFRHTRIDSVAVLPFENTEPGDRLLAAGFTQELTARLRTLPNLRVVSPLFSVNPREAARQLAVEAVLIGTLRSSEGGLRASAQLLNARDGSVLWADEVEQLNGPDFYSAQRVLTSAIAARLRGRLMPAQMAKLVRRGSSSVEAYDLFMRGRAAALRGPSQSDAGVSKAEEYFQRAVELDPGFAEAWAWLALAQQIQFVTGNANRARLAAAINNAHRALSIDPDNIAARRALIYIYDSTGQSEEGLRVAARALEINSQDPETALAAARAYFRASMLDRASALYERYLASYPDDQVARNDFLHVAVFADAYDRGLRAARPALATQNLLYPTFVLYANSGDFARAAPMARQSSAMEQLPALYFGPLVLKAAGFQDEARTAWSDGAAKVTALLSNAENERSRMWLAMIYAQLDRAGEARDQIHRALTLNPEDPWILFFASETHALLGDRAKALACLRKSVSQGFLGLHYLDYYHRKPLCGWNRYRADAEFLEIRNGLALKIAELRRRY